MPGADPRDLVEGLAKLAKWLEHHPDIPVDYVDYLDANEIVVSLGDGAFNVLASAAMAAEVLTDATIDLLNEGYIRVEGIAHSGDSHKPFDLRLEGSVHGPAWQSLMRSLGPSDDDTIWHVTADHLRTVAQRGGGVDAA